ncbi:MAG: hypothetical protein HXO12_04650 [Prevotella salivae]|nr:hypothetical protein [Segatella salivae]
MVSGLVGLMRTPAGPSVRIVSGIPSRGIAIVEPAAPGPLLSSFRRLHEQRPMVLRRERGVVSHGNGGSYFGVNWGR